MGYGNMSDEKAAVCQDTIENRISRVMKSYNRNKKMLKAFDEFIDFHGDYTLKELNGHYMYGQIVIETRKDKKELKSLLKEQKKIGKNRGKK